jgi:hypothetical protein
VVDARCDFFPQLQSIRSLKDIDIWPAQALEVAQSSIARKEGDTLRA